MNVKEPLKKVFMDTESFGLYGATILIQYQIENESIKILDVFNSEPLEVINLIESFVDCDLIGFNLTHDIFHMARTLNIMTCYLLEFGNVKVTVSRYKFIERKYGDPSLPERGETSIYDLCFKPKRVTDLMLIGRQGVFQATMNQKPVTLRKIPKIKAEELIEALLENVEIPKLFFGRKGGIPVWKIKQLHWVRTPDYETLHQVTPEEWSKYKKNPVENYLEISHDLVDLELAFQPSTSLKAICEFELGLEVHEYDFPISPSYESGYHPIGNQEEELLQEAIDVWENDPIQRKYAWNDPRFTREVWNYIVCKEQGLEWYEGMDYLISEYDLEASRMDSELACLVGNCYWSGYSIDRELVSRIKKERLVKEIEYSNKIEYNSRTKVLAWLHEVCSPMMRVMVKGTSKEVLDFLRKEEGELGERASIVYEARRNKLELGLLEKLEKAGRLHVSFKVVGTKSNRMAGGSLEGKGNTINPQGIKKESEIRECFTFKDAGQSLCGGDFSGFEISIMEAVYKDPKLREDLISGKKIHGIWGSFLYGMSYEEILETSELNADHPNGYYSRSKNSIFAQAYGAATPKICQLTNLSVEEVELATRHFESTYVNVGKSKQQILDDHQAMVQLNGMGSRITWKEPKPYVESFLGFRRYFTIEYSVMKALFDLSENLPMRFKSERKIMRGSRTQTITGGMKSAIYAGAFSLQNSLIRAAGNHKIQSPGGQMTKELESKMWDLQPVGIHKFCIKPFNVHDELQVAVRSDLVDDLCKIKDDYIEYRKSVVPLISMDWKNNRQNWKESH